MSIENPNFNPQPKEQQNEANGSIDQVRETNKSLESSAPPTPEHQESGQEISETLTEKEKAQRF